MFKIFKIMPKRMIFLFLLDVVLLFATIAGLFLLILDKAQPLDELLGNWFFLLIPVTYVSFLYVFRGYDLRKIKYSQNVIDVLIKVTIFNLLFWGAIMFLTPDAVFSRKVLVAFSAVAPGVVLIWRYLFAKFIGKKALSEKIIIIGSGSKTREVIRAVTENPDIGYSIGSIIYVAKRPSFKNVDIKKYEKGVIEKIVKKRGVKRVVVSVRSSATHELIKELVRVNNSKTKVVSMQDFYSSVTGKIPVDYLKEDIDFLSCINPPNIYYRAWEFLFNFVASFVMFVILLPVFVLISIMIIVFSPGPILYTQDRIGLHGKKFKFYKFRTMKPGKHIGMSTSKSDPRITGVGRVLRASHLDELPQLINVLNRTMNIIGPRPEQPEFVKGFSREIPFYAERHLVRPGVTGWAQVKQGYGFEETHEKLEYDLYYTKYRSITLDIVILLKTLEEVFTKKAR